MIPVKLHSEKGKTRLIIKRSMVAREWGERKGCIGRAQECLGQWNYYVWYYNGGYISLNICSKS